MNAGSQAYEVLALRYGSLDAPWTDVYLGADSPSAPAEAHLSYYFWLARNDERTVLIDTGFDPAVGIRRGRETLAHPLHMLALIGVDPSDVTDVILTHFHYDHVGNASAFVQARFYAAAVEYEHWVASGKADGPTAPVEPDEMAELARIRESGRLTLLPQEADFDIVGGIRGMWLPGHTPGQIGVRIPTTGPDVVLTSDAAHSIEEIDLDLPFHVFTDLPSMKRSMARIRELTRSGDIVLVLGHEPSVAQRFPTWHGVEGVVQLSPGMQPGVIEMCAEPPQAMSNERERVKS